MYINWQLKQLNLKIVYTGPALSGKTTNLEQIHAQIDPQRRGDLISLKTNEDRTLFFDFLQLELGKICGLTPSIQLYTVPGQTYYEATRKLVLRGADGVVFVADSSPDRIDDNVEAWQSQFKHMESLGLDPLRIPVIVQMNKQDLPNAIAVDTMRQVLNLNGSPVIEAVAIKSRGVFESLKTIIHAVILSVQQEIA